MGEKGTTNIEFGLILLLVLTWNVENFREIGQATNSKLSEVSAAFSSPENFFMANNGFNPNPNPGSNEFRNSGQQCNTCGGGTSNTREIGPAEIQGDGNEDGGHDY